MRKKKKTINYYKFQLGIIKNWNLKSFNYNSKTIKQFKLQNENINIYFFFQKNILKTFNVYLKKRFYKVKRKNQEFIFLKKKIKIYYLLYYFFFQKLVLLKHLSKYFKKFINLLLIRLSKLWKKYRNIIVLRSFKLYKKRQKHHFFKIFLKYFSSIILQKITIIETIFFLLINLYFYCANNFSKEKIYYGRNKKILLYSKKQVNYLQKNDKWKWQEKQRRSDAIRKSIFQMIECIKIRNFTELYLKQIFPRHNIQINIFNQIGNFERKFYFKYRQYLLAIHRQNVFYYSTDFSTKQFFLLLLNNFMLSYFYSNSKILLLIISLLFQKYRNHRKIFNHLSFWIQQLIFFHVIIIIYKF
jgi:hypothetical protein